MSTELFGAIQSNYNKASFELWSWFKNRNIILKTISLPWIIIASISMNIIGIIFSLGIFLDKISIWLQRKRDWFVNYLDNVAHDIKNEKIQYILSPFWATIVFPIALFLGIIPKWSSTIVSVVHPDLDVSTGTEYGYFTQLGQKYFAISKALLSNAVSHGILFSPISLIISIIFTPLHLLIAILLFLLIVLDWLGYIVSLIRKFVVFY